MPLILHRNKHPAALAVRKWQSLPIAPANGFNKDGNPETEDQTVTISNKLFRIALITGALLIPLVIVNLLVLDRSSTASVVRKEVTSGWSGPQILTGPFLVVPFVRSTSSAIKADESPTEQGNALVIAPDSLKIGAGLRPQVRRRSLFEVILYTADVEIDAQFSKAMFAGVAENQAILDWPRAYVALKVSDSRGLGGAAPFIKIDGQLTEARPGSQDFPEVRGVVSASAGQTGMPTGPLHLSARFPLKGSSTLSIGGHARRAAVAMRSAWSHPSFIGSFLPDTHQASAQGFTANWSTTDLALNRPLIELASRSKALDDGQSLAGVALVEPVDLYAQISRAVKYGILFIALTYIVFIVFDATGGRPVPMLAYALVGLGLVLFYILLLALAEYIPLLLAYLIAASALICLIASYSKAVLRSSYRAAVIAVVLTILYGALYVLLQLEAFALLLGSATLLIGLASLMYVTRNIGSNGEVAE